MCPPISPSAPSQILLSIHSFVYPHFHLLIHWSICPSIHPFAKIGSKGQLWKTEYREVELLTWKTFRNPACMCSPERVTTTSPLLLPMNLSVRLSQCFSSSLGLVTSGYHQSADLYTHAYMHKHTHTRPRTHTHTACLSDKNWIQKPPWDTRCMKRLSSKWLMYSGWAPRGPALYW